MGPNARIALPPWLGPNIKFSVKALDVWHCFAVGGSVLCKLMMPHIGFVFAHCVLACSFPAPTPSKDNAMQLLSPSSWHTGAVLRTVEMPH